MAQDAGMVKKETAIIAAIGTLAVGFLAGLVFSAFRSPAPPPMAGGMPGGQQASPQQREAISQAQASQILALEQAVLKDPNNVNLFIELGNTYFDAGNPEKAITTYDKALVVQPNNADVLTDQGVMYLELGQADKAVANFDRAIKANPNHAQSRLNKGIVLFNNMNDKAGAIKEWEELARINPNAKAPNGMVITEFLKNMRQ